METERQKTPPPPPKNLETFLRGMETGGAGRDRGRGSRLETFLRGMETDVERCRPGPRGRALKPSLEGWKQIHVPAYRPGGASLKPSLEGWKLRSLRDVGGASCPLKPSLEGWKLVWGDAEAGRNAP